MKRFVLVLSLFALAAAGPALATDPIFLRLGHTDWDGLNQFHFGLNTELGELWPNVEFNPGFELGLGDDTTLLTVNGDLVYQFTELVTDPWGLYGGGSLSFNWIDTDHYDDADLGLSALGGVKKVFANGHEGFVEIRLGLMDSPDFKLTFGYSLY